MIILGIDPSLTGTGIARIDTDEAAPGQTWTITSKGRATDDLGLRMRRLDVILDQISPLTANLAVIEQPAYSRTVGHMHDRSGLWWLIVAKLIEGGVTVVDVSPSARAKYATGKGNAGKDEVLLAVARRYPGVDVTNNNEADALVLAAMGARRAGHPIDDLPKAHVEVMAKVAWPLWTAARS